ncbi:DUF192 domain-containing protein [Thalassovita aquimarina]|uniref:DUF192 domain-containing protein n=1 Tax=Thalassovita aquimarina TaxID=2785917 RepID=A0ABS5HLW6_9RHOB|nr:DUF192 domain-containing protein [Thalassovita aquimarina]MBR9649960.1 DUF192 domain-containing protein [Thalassovita aquimarina]
MRWLVRTVLAVLWPILATQAAAQDCREDAVFLKGDWGQARFSVELADTDAERARGLMFRETLPRSSGMLFLYPSPRRVAFWMKNTLIPLDMLFIDDAGTVVRIHHRAQPGDLTAIPGGDGVLAVLEIGGGLAEAMGITAGTVLRHPGFDAKDAVWPCADENAD